MSLIKEWEVARDVIAKTDERVDDLRKYGFSFVTTLLTADALVLHSVKDGDAASIPWIALGVSVVAAVLVVAMRLLEKSNQLLQTAAAQRAQVIERHLGLELCDIIVERYRAERWWWQADALYCCFVLAVALVGGLAGGFEDGRALVIVRCILLAALVAVSWAAIYWISSQEVEYRRVQEDDWSLDRVECQQGESIRIMYTRWGTTQWPFTKGSVIWHVQRRVDGAAPVVVATHVADDDDMTDDDCKVWQWKASGDACVPGLYEIAIDPGGNYRGAAAPQAPDSPAPVAARTFVLRRRVRVTARGNGEPLAEEN
ncbi:MAG TPA: hypothetical protein VIF09_02635 [Polyangiaceae bacterium]